MKKYITIMIVALTYTFALCNACMAKDTVKPKTVSKVDSVAMLIQRADSGNAVAQNLLGYWYYVGKNVKKDYQKAANWWAKAAKQENAHGVGNLAMCYQLGHGIKADSVMAMKLYLKAIELGNKDIIPKHERAIAKDRGNLFSTRLLYHCYERGIGVKADPKKAEKLYEVLAEKGDADRQFNLALDYINKQQYEKAIPWLKRAMQKGHVGATFYMGKLTFQGTGVAQDKKQGIAWMEKAAETQFPGACLELGKIYLKGDGVEANAPKGAEYLKQTAGVSSEAGWLLGLCYLKGEGVAQDYHFAAQWIAEYVGSHKKEFNQLFEDGNKDEAFSQYLWGLKHYYIYKDYDKAVESFSKVSKAKHQEGTMMTALCLAQKEYRKHHAKKAFKLMEKAAKAVPAAQYHLAMMYGKGEGVKRDQQKSLELLQKAADGGVAEAQCALGDKYMAGDIVARDYVKAAKLYLAAESQRQLSEKAAKGLAECYKKHVLALPDLDNANARVEKLNKHKSNSRLADLLKIMEK
ncbi:MAG: sel1 repeat family protein [Prevotella sp.]|nr:sel1 repeat family protein [Prevotella sp.]